MYADIYCRLLTYSPFFFYSLFNQKIKKMENYNQPAFPPQVAQDNLGRIIAPIPGMSKLEYAAIQLLPWYLDMGKSLVGLRHNGKNITPYQAAVIGATELFNAINDKHNETDTTTIIEQP
jgi:hypothetical protein